jgi:hypothetical protein
MKDNNKRGLGESLPYTENSKPSARNGDHRPELHFNVQHRVSRLNDEISTSRCRQC